MGNAVAEFLQPFGVDVDIKVADKKTDEEISKAKTQAPAAEPPTNEKPPTQSEASSSSGAYKSDIIVIWYYQ